MAETFSVRYGSPGRSPGMTGATGARPVDGIVLQRPRCSIFFHGQDCALKYGSPGRSPGMTQKKYTGDDTKKYTKDDQKK